MTNKSNVIPNFFEAVIINLKFAFELLHRE